MRRKFVELDEIAAHAVRREVRAGGRDLWHATARPDLRRELINGAMVTNAYAECAARFSSPDVDDRRKRRSPTTPPHHRRARRQNGRLRGGGELAAAASRHRSFP